MNIAGRTQTLVLLTLTLNAVAAHADETAKAKADISAQYQQMSKQIMSKQFKPFLTHFTPDYTMKYMGQTMSRKQYERDIMQGLKNFANLKVRVDVKKFALNKNKANVQTIMTQSGKTVKPVEGLPPTSGKSSGIGSSRTVKPKAN
jgi:murein L,D-transpeptidase YafK